MQPTGRPQSPFRGSSSTTRGNSATRGRGRGRGGTQQPATSQQSHGTTFRGRASQAFRGTARGSRGSSRGRGAGMSQRFNSPPTEGPRLPYDVPADSIKAHNPAKIAARREQLKNEYEIYRETAINNGLMSSDAQSSIDQAIKTRGTCTDMCDPKERVERIFQNAVDAEETLPSTETGHPVAIEGRMVKKFRRAAAGVDRQIPQELRTPKTLQRTLDYLFREIIGRSQRYGKHHKFVWDRSRAIRNDFNIQSFSRPEDIKYEVDCYERIVRFHILSLHVMSEPEEQKSDEEYNRQQEIEQLQKTFASLMDRYDSFGRSMHFKNEAEFRAYYILFVSRTTLYDIDTVMQYWPSHILADGRVKTALRLHELAGNIEWPTGSSNLDPIPSSIAQANAGSYWTLLQSQQVGYLMACVAEISFQLVRFTALNALWKSSKGAPRNGQSAMRAWTKPTLTDYLGFDDEEQTEEFVLQFGIAFTKDNSSEEHLDFQSSSEATLERMKYNVAEKASQVFSYALVEQKRQGRTYEALLNGLSIAAASRKGMVVAEAAQSRPTKERNDMFIGEEDEDDDDDDELDKEVHEEQNHAAATQKAVEPIRNISPFNPGAAAFTPGAFGGSSLSTAPEKPAWLTNFGSAATSDPAPKTVFGFPQQERTSTVFGASESVPAAQTAVGSAASKQPTFNFSTFSSKTDENATPAPSAFTISATNRSPFGSTQLSVEPSTETNEAGNQISETKPPFSFLSSPQGQDLQPARPSPSLDASTTVDQVQPAKIISDVDNPGHSFFSPNSGSSTIFPSQATPALETSSIKFGLQPAASPSSEAEAIPKPFSLSSFATSSQIKPSVQESTSPPTPTERPSFGNFSFPKVDQIRADTISHTPAGNLDRKSDHQSEPTPLSLNKVITKSAASPLPTPSSLIQPSSQTNTPSEVIDKEDLLENLCRIGLVQQNGILEHFTALRVNQLVLGIFAQQRETAIAELRKQILRRKWFSAWASIVRVRKLRKRADNRRKKILAATQAEEEKQRRREFDMTQIANAQREREQIVAERKKSQEKAERKEKEPGREVATNVQAQAGQKRKTFANSTSQSNIQGISMSPMHKRSRTMGNESSSTLLPRASSSPSRAQSPKVILGQESSTLRRSISQKSLRQSLTQQRVDATRTDYFRLKAMGLDPNGPAFSTSVKGKEKDQDAILSSSFARRSLSNLSATSSPNAPAQVPSTTNAMTAPRSLAHEKLQTLTGTNTSIDNVSEDTVLRAARLARESLQKDSETFKIQYAEWESDVRQQEELRKSQSSVASNDNSFTRSVNGFAKSTSGHDYMPAELRPGQSLSRTEERIRRTGARGLANKPIGGSPAGSPRDSYVPVPMSKRSASALQQAESPHPITNGTAHGQKRSFSDDAQAAPVKAARVASPADIDLASHAVKQTQSKPTMQTLRDLSRNPYIAASYDDEDDEPSDEEEYEEEYEDEEEELAPVQNGQYYTESTNLQKAYGENYAEEEEEYDEDEDEEEEEEDEELEYAHAHPGKPGLTWNNSTEYEDDGLAPQHDSRAVSASAATPDTTHGGTAADAIELDSD